MNIFRARNMAGILCVFCLASAIASAQTFKTLADFHQVDGWGPNGPLVQGTDGYFYGTTNYDTGTTYGTLFKMTAEGSLFTGLFYFCPDYTNDCGGYPTAGLVQGSGGAFYGTTTTGGSNNGGVVFTFRFGKFTTLYNFSTGVTAPSGPNAPLVQGSDGSFYGTTYYGGTNGRGTIFRITYTGQLTVLYSFCAQANCADGAVPYLGGLVQGTDGNFYGTTLEGGVNEICANSDYPGCGTVFKISPAGKLTTLYTFCSQSNCTDGVQPWAGLVQGSDGNFYGTTYAGGSANSGTVFRITPRGALTTLYSFCALANCSDGAQPGATLIEGTDGNFYGTTNTGGGANYGTVFQITPGGTLTTLHAFCLQSSCDDGYGPIGGLVQGTNGTFYGTVGNGGGSIDSAGNIFSLSMGLGPFIRTQTSSGKVGSTVVILGTSLTGATAVSFNGTSATFTVVQSSEIEATVPAGATTGFVTVTTPSGTLKSNAAFVVAR